MTTAVHRFLFAFAAATMCCLCAPGKGAGQPYALAAAEERQSTQQEISTGEALRYEGAPGSTLCKTMRVVSRGIVADAGKQLLEFAVDNRGAAPLSTALSVDLFEDGERVAQFRATLGTIPPGSTLHRRIDLSELPPGQYQALTIVQNRDGEISGTREDLEIE